MTYSKTISENDYQRSDLFQHIDSMTEMLSGSYTAWGTPYRKWEYGMVLTALRENGARTVLEVGGGSSMFAASAIWAGFDVTVVEPENYASMFREQSARIGKTIPFVHADFFDYPTSEKYDAVTCVSVIEHVHEDAAFFQKLLKHVKPGGLLCLTTDFSPEGKQIFGGHLTTYNAEKLMRFVDMAKSEGFEVFGGDPDYDHFEQNVHGLYSFASLVLKRVK